MKFAAGLTVLVLWTWVDSRPHAAVRPGRFVIGFFRGALPEGLSREIAGAGGHLVRSLPDVGLAVAVSANPHFESSLFERPGLHIDFIGPVPVHALPATVSRGLTAAPTSSDEFFNAGKLWGVNRVRADAAWNVGITGSHRTKVAVIDVGVAWNHPDLATNVVFATCYTVAPSCNPYPSLSDHGTHVAGTIASAFGGGGTIGVGPNLGLASYNVFEDIPDCGICSYADSRWAAMIDAAARGFKIINLSLGGTYVLGGRGSNRLAASIAAERRVAGKVIQAGAVIVASAGNSSLDLSGRILHLPGDIQGIVNVAATGIRPLPRFPQPAAFDVRAFYSNYGAPITLSAPGGDAGPEECCEAGQPESVEYLVLSTAVYPDPGCAINTTCLVGYEWKGGTSMAAAHVAGAAGLIRDANPALTPHQVATILKSTAEHLGSRQQFGHGMVNAFDGVRKAIDH
jgi:subtilisin family serine protease